MIKVNEELSGAYKEAMATEREDPGSGTDAQTKTGMAERTTNQKVVLDRLIARWKEDSTMERDSGKTRGHGWDFVQDTFEY